MKEHRKRVQHRNQTLTGLRKKAQAEYKEMFEKTMESLKAQYQSENGEMMDVNAEIISDEMIQGNINQIDVSEVQEIKSELTNEN